MKEENLIVQEKKKRKYSSYLGEISPEVERLNINPCKCK